MKTTLKLIALLSFAWSYSQAPAYYDDVNTSLTGQSLLNELADKITDTHTTFLSYTPGVWEALQDADVDPSNNSDVLLIYGFNDSDSDLTNDRSRGVNDNGGNNDDWNREHVFPRSLGNPNLGSTGPGSDAHHIRPADVSRNSSRSNRKFADSSGNSGATSNGYWYPGDEWKGDVARMIMFMYLRYDDRCLPSAVGVGNALSNDSNMIDLFLEWNVEDPVSSFEQQRNDAIANIQGNRNPFIDNPAFATNIWGGAQAEDLFGNDTPTGDNTATLLISEYVEGSSFNKAIEITNTSSSSINLSSYSLKRQTNGAGSWSTALNLSGTLSSGNVFVVANSNASSTLTNIADATTSSTVMSFNGNDPVGLFFNDSLIDIVGTFNGGSSNNFGANTTLVRNSSITSGTTSYNSAQWTSYASDTFSFLGSTSGGGVSNSTVSTTLTIVFDNYSSETSWEILDSSNTRIDSGSGYTQNNGTSIDINMTLPEDCYTFSFYDSYGDGICCTQGNGSYSLKNNTTGNTLTSGAAFATTDTKNFCLSSSASKTTTEQAIATSENVFGVVLYPNPAVDTIYFTTENKATNVIYNIYNQAGAEVKSGISTENTVPVDDLAVGMYFIEINGLPISSFIKN